MSVRACFFVAAERESRASMSVSRRVGQNRTRTGGNYPIFPLSQYYKIITVMIHCEMLLFYKM
jgi:hypothetical protein